MTKLLLSLLTMLILSACGDAPSSPPQSKTKSGGAQDIAGLKIGMSPDEVRQILPQINPKFTIKELRGGYWSTLFMSAGVQAPDGSAEAVVVQFTETQPQAFFIGRSISYPKGSRPTKDDLQKELLAKYGGRHVNGVTGLHQMTESVKPESKPDVYGFTGCRELPGESRYRASGDAPPFFMRNVTVDCDRLLEAMLGQSFGESPLIASGLAVSITDFALARSDPKHPANVRANNNQRMIEEARKNKPKL